MKDKELEDKLYESLAGVMWADNMEDVVDCVMEHIKDNYIKKNKLKELLEMLKDAEYVCHIEKYIKKII